MLKITAEQIESLESSYPGIKEQILRFEIANLPSCTFCKSNDTADVQIGVIGRTISICAATTKFRLIPNRPRPGRYICNSCGKFFNSRDE
jgi:transposase-like protein